MSRGSSFYHLYTLYHKRCYKEVLAQWLTQFNSFFIYRVLFTIVVEEEKEGSSNSRTTKLPNLGPCARPLNPTTAQLQVPLDKGISYMLEMYEQCWRIRERENGALKSVITRFWSIFGSVGNQGKFDRNTIINLMKYGRESIVIWGQKVTEGHVDFTWYRQIYRKYTEANLETL